MISGTRFHLFPSPRRRLWPLLNPCRFTSITRSPMDYQNHLQRILTQVFRTILVFFEVETSKWQERMSTCF